MRGRFSQLAATSLVVGAILLACGDPVDPGAPEIPGEDGGVTSESACFGAPDGTKCPGNRICVRGVCSDPICGDGVLTAPEECDKGLLNGPGSGCETSCKLTCVANDPARNCASPSGSCVANGTCDAETHTCKPGGPKPTGESCGPAKFCKGNECVDSVCGDAVTTSPEDCDNGNANGPGTGCESTCKFSCKTPATDCPVTPCNVATCGADHRCATTPDPTKNDQACGQGLVCKNGACIAPNAVCGNGILELGEDCDFGAGNGKGTGCETICKFSCTMAAGSCVDPNACNAAPTCTVVTVGGKTGQKCVNGAPKADGTTCGVGSICLAGACKPSICGDGYRDDAKGEQCDDSNTTKLDACSDQCKFEQDQRVVSMKLQFGTDAFCTVNAVGGAIGFLARGSFQTSIDDGIKDGSISALFTFSGDLTGATGPVDVGNLSGAPPSNAPPYNGTADLDWWYGATLSSIDANRNPRAMLKGSYTNNVLDATGRLNLITSIGGSIASLAVSSAKLKVQSGASTTPLTAAANAPPGHLAAEHLKTLQSYATAGGTNLGSPAGQMCGNIAASSLENALPPLALLPGGANECNEKYTSANRLIDIIVNGCKVTNLNVTAVKPTQPDQVDPDAPVAGAGGPYNLAVDPATKRVTTCRDKNNAVVPLQACLNAAAYSISFKYATDRVIIK